MAVPSVAGPWLPFLALLLLTACNDAEAPNETTPSLPEATPTSTVSPTQSPSPTPGMAVIPDLIRGAVPSDGAMAVPRFPEVQISFSENIPDGQESLISAQITGSSGTINLLVDSAREIPGDNFLAMLPESPLDAEADYQLSVTIESMAGVETQDFPQTFASTFSTTIPCGVAFNIAEDIIIHALGGNEALVRILQETLEQTTLDPVALMFVDTTGSNTFPLNDLRVVAGLPSKVEDGLYTPDRTYGFPVSVDPCSLDEQGTLNCVESTFVFPIPITDDTVLYLAISNAQLGGIASSSGDFVELDDFTLEGVITEEDLIIALEAVGLPSLVDYIKLDVDTNSDGIPDAAYALASSNPSFMNFEDCDVSPN